MAGPKAGWASALDSGVMSDFDVGVLHDPITPLFLCHQVPLSLSRYHILCSFSLRGKFQSLEGGAQGQEPSSAISSEHSVGTSATPVK